MSPDASASQDGNAIPNVEDSPAWSVPDAGDGHVITLEEAITVVLTVGERMRKCRECKSSATEIRLLSYKYRHGTTHAYVQESCLDCDCGSSYYVPAILWACVEAMRAWEGVRTATAIFSSEGVPPDQT